MIIAARALAVLARKPNPTTGARLPHGWRGEQCCRSRNRSEIPDEAALAGNYRKIPVIVRSADGPVQARGVGEEPGLEVTARGELEPLRAKLTKLADRRWLQHTRSRVMGATRRNRRVPSGS
ncbi:hypothetical protein OG588_22320 [Streptomyces prunicolor]|uniref:hypothetical protein n=1 Tax=Streptomyces prunicolor TaxID=67348 RepID=UPI00386C2CCE|nr:hypothetical protein OG588_22320 [Streptomyces prunicolor]